MDKYEPDEILNLAIMSKSPCIIVEGVDDIRIYEGVAGSVDVPCEVYPVEMIEGLPGGSVGVIQAMSVIESLSMPAGKSAHHFVMGIIDRDARFFRGELPALASVFCLDLYSIENHFVSKYAIKPAVDRLTRVSPSVGVDVELIYSNIEAALSDLYYFSLEALKGAVDSGYQSVVGFSSNVGRRKDVATAAQLHLKKVDLDLFAASHGLTSDINSLRKFVKGKWLLHAFAEGLYDEVAQLVSRCKSASIIQCRMCQLDLAGPCLFRLRDGLNKNSLCSILLDFIHLPDFDYIRERFRSLSTSAAE